MWWLEIKGLKTFDQYVFISLTISVIFFSPCNIITLDK